MEKYATMKIQFSRSDVKERFIRQNGAFGIMAIAEFCLGDSSGVLVTRVREKDRKSLLGETSIVFD